LNLKKSIEIANNENSALMIMKVSRKSKVKKIIKSNLQNIEKEKRTANSAYQYSGTFIDLYFIPVKLVFI
jgi:hypothetical protein